jgi:hypothetical protein
MAHDEQPLPRPPATPFGRSRSGGDPESGPLTADRMAAAQAQGRLEEFLARELPDNPRARDLATMMLGMTGMAPPTPPPAPPGGAPPADTGAPAAPVPPEVLAAIGRGDPAEVMQALRREHARRSPDAAVPPDPRPDASPQAPAAAGGDGGPAIDRETLDAMLRIAADNGVTPDWITFRALKLYVEEYRKTGRL